MSIGQTAKSLWKRAPAWRFTTIGAAALSVMVAVSWLGGGGRQPPVPAPVNPSTAQNSGGGTLGQQGTAAPVPSNATVMVPRATATPEAEARWIRFLTEVDSANLVQRMGERCNRMADTLDLLQADDYAWAQSDRERRDALRAATDCADNIRSSDRRLEALAAAYGRSRTDGSASVTRRLGDARDRLVPFDLSRDLAPEMQDAVAAGDAAMELLKRSDGRIAALKGAAAAARASGGASAAATLADAARGITAFDEARMDAVQSADLEDGRTAVERIKDSDDRIGDVLSTLAVVRSSTQAGSQQTLIDAVAALTPFDLDRASGTERGRIDEARSLAADVAMDRLLEASARFEPDGTDPAAFEQLRNLRSLIEENGGIEPSTAEQAAALRVAELATAKLEDSNRRLRQMSEAAAAWRRNPGPDQERAIRAAYEAVQKPFDRNRMTAAMNPDYQTVASAFEIVEANEVGLTPGNKAQVPLYVTDASGAEYGSAAARTLRDRLSAGGYSVVDTLEQAAVRLEITSLSVDPSSIQVGSRSYEGAVVDLALVASWTFGDEVFLRASGAGRAAGRSFQAAAEDAVAEATGDVFGRFDDGVRGNGG